MSDLRPARPLRTPLAQVAAWLDLPFDGADDVADDEVVVTGVSLGSQRVQAGDLYAALPGARRHGAEFAADAIGAGAVAVLTDPAGADLLGETSVPVLVHPTPRAVLGRLAARLYGDPGEALTLIGVTGTQGKTTTTRLAEGGLHQAGVVAAVVGTVGTRIAGRDVATSLTTPEAPDLQGLFAVMRERDVEVCAMEVSSHALVLGRVDGTVFDVAVFLNLGRDHLDFHPTLEDYFQAKASLFTTERARLGLVDVDDEHGRRLVEQARAGGLSVRTMAIDRDADWRATDVVSGPGGSTFTLRGPDGLVVEARCPLAGRYNVANTLAALAACGEAGLDVAAVARGIAEGPGVPGRLERVATDLDLTVVVDYAHKPDAVEAALTTLRPLTRGRLLVVLGAGGDRDPGKRPLMGELAARLADVLVVTDDNPRTEDPAAIRAAVAAGAAEVPDAERAETHDVSDRRAAIARALSLAAPGDVVVVAGKGHETGQEAHGVVTPFDDRVVVAEEAARLAAERVGENPRR